MQYSIGPTGITRSVLGRQRQLGWAMIRRISQDSRGVQVFFDRTPSIQSILQSFYIMANADDLESLVAAFQYYLSGRPKTPTL
jgi:glutamine amidotransferase PdxT